MNDDELAQAFAARSPAAFDEAYRRHASVLHTVARSVLGRSEDAQDCVHDVLLRAWNNRSTYRPERGALRAFLVVCVRNEALSRRRSDARHYDLELRSAHVPLEGEQRFEDVDHVEIARLRRALQELPPEQRAVVDLAYFAGLTQSEVAAKLREPLGTVKSRASLALRKLTAALNRQNHEQQQ